MAVLGNMAMIRNYVEHYGLTRNHMACSDELDDEMLQLGKNAVVMDSDTLGDKERVQQTDP